MECKFVYPDSYIRNAFTELIDTLWNVNFFTADIPPKRDIELIDTLWNVNAVFALPPCCAK